MKVILNVENTATAQYTVSENEVVTDELLTCIVFAARDAGALNVDVIVPISRISTERGLLESSGFFAAGSLTLGHPHQETYLRFRHSVTNAGDGNHGAVAFPVLAPTAEEVAAAELVRARYGSPLSDARLAELAAMGRQPEPEAKLDPIMDRLRAEISRLESEL